MKTFLKKTLSVFVLFNAIFAIWVSATEGPRVVSPQEIEQTKIKYGSRAAERLEQWQELVDNNQHKSEQEKLEIVNDFFNHVRFIDDIVHWNKKDYWATPLEMLATDAGDCEDYSIAKYFTLKALGVPESKLYITYVKAIRLNQAHMVLTYFKTPKSVPLVLDNINKRILEATRRTDLVPIYSFNGDGLWLARQRGKGKSVSGGTSKLKNWNSLLERLNK
ncbi:MAG: transglutaminase-like cysteine peptidase [Thiomicrorhabdus sp.]|nr:transglutaminase-like cysteine peptidase [Thiomicrorhabdus sp.]